jgi:hypothetical protein
VRLGNPIFEDEAKTTTLATFPRYPAPHKLSTRIQDKQYGLNGRPSKAKHNGHSKKRRILLSKASGRTNSNSRALLTTAFRPGISSPTTWTTLGPEGKEAVTSLRPGASMNFHLWDGIRQYLWATGIHRWRWARNDEVVCYKRQASELIRTAWRLLAWANSGIHSPIQI